MGNSGVGTRVVKSSGETETFDPNVINTECMEAGIDLWIAADIALEVSKNVFDGINSEEIQRKILDALYTRNPELAERYRRFHSMLVRSSNNTIERFDRKRIVQSLVKETTLPKEVGEIIARETEAELRKLNLEFTSGPLIREVVNVKLLEHGYESARSDYTRLGMPVYDAAEFMDTTTRKGGIHSNPGIVHAEMANSILREYTLLKILPLHIADSHMKGEIHIHGLEYFATRPYTAVHDLRFFLMNGLKLNGHRPAAGPAKKGLTAVLHSVKALIAHSPYFSSDQSLNLFNVWMAPYLKGLEEREIAQLAQTFLYEITQSQIGCENNPMQVDIGLEHGVPDNLLDTPAVIPGGVRDGSTYRDFEDEAKAFSKAVLEVYLKGDINRDAFKNSRVICSLREGYEVKEGFNDYMELIHKIASKKRNINLLNFSTSTISPLSAAHAYGIIVSPKNNQEEHDIPMQASTLQLAALNLPRAAYEARGDDTTLYENIDRTLILIRESSMIKREVLEKRHKKGALPLFNKGYFDLEKSVNLIGFVGLNEAVKAHLGEELHESKDSRLFATSILEHISKGIAGWNETTGLTWLLTSAGQPSVARRFATLDSGQYTKALSLRGDTERTGITYSESCHIPRAAHISTLEGARLMSPFYSLSSGGIVDAIQVNNEGADELHQLSLQMQKAGSPHWSYIS